MPKNCFLALLVLLVYLTVTKGATLPAGFTETAITGLSAPTAIEIAPDDASSFVSRAAACV